VAVISSSNTYDIDSQVLSDELFDDNGNGDLIDDDESVVKVYVKEKSTETLTIKIPNTFTPNNDGINDVFMIENLPLVYPNFDLKIFNRWGNVVYSYVHNGNVDITPLWWDGYSAGRMTLDSKKLLPSGTYYYVLNFNDGKSKPIASWLYLNK